MKRFFAILLILPFLAACEEATGPDGSNNPGSSTVTMTQLADLPMNGGDISSIAITQSNGLILAMDGKLYSMSSPTGSMQLINGDAVHSTIALAPSGELYTVTATDIRTYDLAAGTHRDVPIDPAGPFALGRRIEDVEIIISPAGEPYVKLINNTPQTYVYYSTDKGASWKGLSMPPGFQYNGGLAFAANGDVLMSSTFGFYRSSDRGLTWSTHPTARAGYGGRLYTAANGDIYHYPPAGGGLMVSRNGGASFTELTPFNAHPFFTTLQQGADGALYGLAYPGLLRSTDGGTTWRTVVFGQGRAFATRGSTIAVGLQANGFSVQENGGMVVSQNNGATWTSVGTQAVKQIVDAGFDKDKNLMILADYGLYRRVGSEWQTIGTRPLAFMRFASTSQGAFLLASQTSVFHSSDNGVTWNEHLIQDYSPGIDPAGPTVLLPRKNGEFLLSITSYSDARGYSNGHLYRIGANGVPVRIRTATATFSSIIEDPNGVLYGGESVLDPFSQTYYSRRYKSVDGGTTWDEEPQTQPVTVLPRAYNSAGKGFYIGSNEYTLRAPGSEAKTDVKLQGFTSESHYITRALFGSDDKLYLITLDKGLFMSSAAVR